MAVVRINKTQNYTVISNYHFQEKDMSLKAKGLLSLMLSLPDDWDYSISGLVAICKESKTSIQSTLKELEEFGYLARTRVQNSKGQFEYIYDIFEKPQEKKPRPENLCTDNQCTENMPQLNTNKQNTKELNTKDIKKVSKACEDEKPAPDKNKSFDSIIDDYTENEDLRSELKEHLKTRKSKKAAMTNRAIELSLGKLDKLSNNDTEKIQIVQNAIMNGWTTFYPLKDEQSSKSTSGNSPRKNYDFGLGANYDLDMYESNYRYI